MTKCTNAQLSALKWLINRGGDGVFARGPVLLAQGEDLRSQDPGEFV